MLLTDRQRAETGSGMLSMVFISNIPFWLPVSGMGGSKINKRFKILSI